VHSRNDPKGMTRVPLFGNDVNRLRFDISDVRDGPILLIIDQALKGQPSAKAAPNHRRRHLHHDARKGRVLPNLLVA